MDAFVIRKAAAVADSSNSHTKENADVVNTVVISNDCVEKDNLTKSVDSKFLERRDSWIALRQKSMTDFAYYEQRGSKRNGGAPTNGSADYSKHIENGNPYVFYHSKYNMRDVRPPVFLRTVDSLCVQRLKPAIGATLKAVSLGRTCNGVSCMSFNDGVTGRGTHSDNELLLAVAGLNGIVRVYDFPSLSRALGDEAPEQQLGVNPTYVVETSRDISDLRWIDDGDNTRFSNQFAVSYTFQAVVHIYDLSMTTSGPLKIPARVLDSVGKSFCGGFSALLSFGGGEMLIAGGTNGVMRMWSGSVGPSARRVVWECPADVLKGAAQSIPAVVGLALMDRLRFGTVASLLRSGVVCLWDIEHLTVKSFGSSKTPTLLTRIALFDLCGSYGGGAVGMCRVDAAREHVVAVTQKDGGVLLVGLLPGAAEYEQLLSRPDPCPAKSPAAVTAEANSAPQLPSGYCSSAVFPSLATSISCVGVPGSNVLRFIDHCPLLSPRSGSKRRRADMQRVEGVATLTLPGAVRYAERGSCELVLTDNLHKFIASPAVASSSSSLSSVLFLDYSFSDVKHAVTSAHTASASRRQSPDSNVATYTVSSIHGNIVTLSEPYQGPAVADSYPRVLLRTDLQAAGRKAAPNPNLTLRGDSSAAMSAQRVLREIKMVVPVTAVACSRTQAFLTVAGHCDDSLTVLSPFV